VQHKPNTGTRSPTSIPVFSTGSSDILLVVDGYKASKDSENKLQSFPAIALSELIARMENGQNSRERLQTPSCECVPAT
jgi:hypothetical protein